MVDVSVDNAVLAWLFVSGVGAGILSRLLGASLYRALNSR